MLEKKTDRMVNIEKEKYEMNSLHVDSCYDFIRTYLLYGFRKINTIPLYAHNSYNMSKQLNNLIYSLHFYHFNQNS